MPLSINFTHYAPSNFTIDFAINFSYSRVMNFSFSQKIIREQMKIKGMRPEDLASRAGIAYATALKAIKGRNISATVHKAISFALGFPEGSTPTNNPIFKERK